MLRPNHISRTANPAHGASGFARRPSGGALDTTIAYIETTATGGALGDIGNPYASASSAIAALVAEHGGSPVPVTLHLLDTYGNIDLSEFGGAFSQLTISGEGFNILYVDNTAWDLTIDVTTLNLLSAYVPNEPVPIPYTVQGTATIVDIYSHGSPGASGGAGSVADASGVNGPDGDLSSPNGGDGTPGGIAVAGNGTPGESGYIGRTFTLLGNITLVNEILLYGGAGGNGGSGGDAYAHGGNGGNAYDDGMETPADGGTGGDAGSASAGSGGDGGNGGNGGSISIGPDVIISGTIFVQGGAGGLGAAAGIEEALGGSAGLGIYGGNDGSAGANGTLGGSAIGGTSGAAGTDGTITYL